VHNVYTYPSWLERFADSHPEQIEELRKDLQSGRITEEQRPVADVGDCFPPVVSVRTLCHPVWLACMGYVDTVREAVSRRYGNPNGP
jgi:hypothetical protein